VKISVTVGQKLFPYGNYAPVMVEVGVEDDLKEGETVDDAYARLSELQKLLMCTKIIEALDTSEVDPYKEKDGLIHNVRDLLDSLDMKLIEKND